MRDEGAESSLEVLVVHFGLAVRLRVVCRGELSFGAKDSTQGGPKARDKLWSSVGSDAERWAKVSVHMVEI